MNILDYAPSFFVLSLAVLAVVGHSKDESKNGIKAITTCTEVAPRINKIAENDRTVQPILFQT